MSSVPHECPPAGRRCFDCNPRVPDDRPSLAAAVTDLPSWARVPHGAEPPKARSNVARVIERLGETLTLHGVEYRVARALAPELAAAVVGALDVDGDAQEVLGAFIDRLQRGTR